MRDIEEDIPTSFVEDLVKIPPIGKEGEEVKRVAVTRLAEGIETNLHLSALDLLRRDGWNPDTLSRAAKGDHVFNITGERFQILEFGKKHIKIKNVETEQEGFIDFEPRSVKAHEYQYRIQDARGKHKIITVYDLAYKDKSSETAEFIDEIIGAIPAQHFDSVDEIRIDRESLQASGFFRDDSSMLSSRKVINLYVNPNEKSLSETLETFYHEFGHALAKALRGTTHPGPKWKKAMESDGNFISKYSWKKRYRGRKNKDNGEVEDFAETVRLYLMTDGAKNPKYAALRAACSNRFKILDELFEDPNLPEVTSVLGRIQRRFRERALTISTPLD